MFKDKDRQREANRDASQRRRDRKGMTQGMTNQGMTAVDEQPNVIPRRGKDIKCFADLPPDVQQTIDKISDTTEEHIKRTEAAVNYQHLFPNSYEPSYWNSPDVRDETNTIPTVTGKPGDADYNGVCTDEWRAERGR